MSRYKSGDIVKYKYESQPEIYEVRKHYQYGKLAWYELEDEQGIRHNCYYPNKLKLVKRLI